MQQVAKSGMPDFACDVTNSKDYAKRLYRTEMNIQNRNDYTKIIGKQKDYNEEEKEQKRLSESSI